MRRRKSPLVFTLFLGLVLTGLGFVAASPAAADILSYHSEEVSYDCMTGQTVGVQPGRVFANNGDVNNAFISFAEMAIHNGDQDPADTYRTGQIAEDGHSVGWVAYYGLPLSSSGMLEVVIGVDYDGDNLVHSPSSVWCEGDPLDTDGDGKPDDIDVCPTEPSDNADGCPTRAVLPEVSWTSTPSHPGMADGSVTLTVKNPVDDTGNAVTYTIDREGSVMGAIGPLADGASASATFASGAGTYWFCARGDDMSSACVEVTVAVDSSPAYAQGVGFTNTCRGIRTTVKNTGWKSAKFHIFDENWAGIQIAQATRILQPGESMSLLSGRDYRVTSYVERLTPSRVLVAQRRWTVPSGCVPMIGGSKVVSWGKKLTRHRGKPVITVRTKASSTRLGYQWKKGVPPAFVKTVGPGYHKLALPKVKRHSKRCYRIWVQHGYNTPFVYRISKWHCYRRP